MQRIVSVIMMSLVVCSCMSNPSTQPMPEMGSFGDSGNLETCSIAIEKVYCWRDWQPIVEKPGRDAGSPLYIKTQIHIDNSQGPTAQLSWDAYVFEVATQTFHPIDLIDKNGSPKWQGEIRGSEVRNAELMTHDGPYLDVGSQIILVLHLKNQEGRAAWVKSSTSKIERTD